VVYAFYGMRLAREEGFSLLPARVPGMDIVLGLWEKSTLNLAGSMMAQSVVKHLLTQGDTLLVTTLSTAEAQGVYALANNYGGLVARLVFQPVEESSRNYFSRVLASSSTIDSPTAPEKADKKTTNDSKDGKKPTSNIHLAATNLTSLLRIYTTLSLPILTLGPSAAPLLLYLVAGPRWARSGASACLSTYSLYIPLLALNGLLEAFVASAASERQVHLQSLWMGGFSVAFALAGYVFLRVLGWGGVGLVLANWMNMGLRIGWCSWWIAEWFGERGVEWEVGGWAPGPGAVGVSVVVSGLVRRVVGAGGEVQGVRDVLVGLGKIAGVGVPYLAVL
jgi:oligosaccharide translocation protein RFT1